MSENKSEEKIEEKSEEKIEESVKKPAVAGLKKVFNDLFNLDLKDQVKTKNKLSYVSWAVAYEQMMKYDPEASWKILKQNVDEKGNERFWFDDGKSAWVETSVTVMGETKTQMLPIMDFKNLAIPADKVTAVDANKAVMRCFVKNLALFGLGLYIYQGEDLPEASKEIVELRTKTMEAAKAKFSLKGEIKDKAIQLCKEAQAEAFPLLLEEQITGDISEIEDIDILQNLYTKLRTMRKKASDLKTEGK